jgi:hypothetical protein
MRHWRAGSGRGWTGRVACGLVLVGLAGCGEGAGLLAGALVDASSSSSSSRGGTASGNIRVPRNEPDVAQVIRTQLRSTPGGCEVEVTYRNTADRSADIGFTYELLDAAGTVVGTAHTAVRGTPPGATDTLLSGNTTAGPTGVPCARVARVQLKSTMALVLPS